MSKKILLYLGYHKTDLTIYNGRRYEKLMKMDQNEYLDFIDPKAYLTEYIKKNVYNNETELIVDFLRVFNVEDEGWQDIFKRLEPEKYEELQKNNLPAKKSFFNFI